MRLVRACTTFAVVASLFALPALSPASEAGDDAVVIDSWVSASSPAAAAVWGMGGSSAALVASTLGTGTFRSTDNGRHWEPVDTGVEEARIAFDPTEPLRGYIAGYGGLARTTDGGASWESIVARSPAQRIDVSPTGAVAITTMEDGYVWVHVSTDHGDTWTVRDAPSARWTSAYGIIMGSTVDDLVYSSIGNTWASHDGGQTWAETGHGARAMVRAEDGSIWRSASNGVYRSLDDGDTWTGVPSPHGAPPVLAARPGGGVWGSSGQGVVGSSPDGLAWTDMGFDNLGFVSTSIMTDPEDPQAVLMSDESIGVHHIGPDGAGGYRAETRTTGFSPIMLTAVGGSHDGSMLLAGGPLSLFQSEDGGQTWVANGAGVGFPTLTAAAANVDGSILYAGGRNWVFGPYLQVSRDGGASWETQLPDDNDGHVRRVETHPSDPLRAWAVVDAQLAPGLLIETTNAGESWTTLFAIEGLHDVTYQASTDRLFVATDVGVFVQEGTLFVPVQAAREGSFAVEAHGDDVFTEGQPMSVWKTLPGLVVPAPWADTGKFVYDIEPGASPGSVWVYGSQTLHRCVDRGTGSQGSCVSDVPTGGVLAVHAEPSSGRLWAGTATTGLWYTAL